MKKQLDLFASGVVRTHDGFEAWAVDIIPHPEIPRMKQADLVIQPIPFDDNEFDLVTIYDGLEHLPFLIYYGMQPIRREPVVELFNEIYRVLKPDGEFYSQTPVFPNKMVWQDPTHASVWTEETFNYFSGDYYGFHEHYDFRFDFQKISQDEVNGHIYTTLKAIKPMREEFKVI